MELLLKLKNRLKNLTNRTNAAFLNRILAIKNSLKAKKSPKSPNKRRPLLAIYHTILQLLESFKQAMTWILVQLNFINPLRFLPDFIESSFRLMGMWISSLRHLDVIFVSVVLFMSVKIAYDKFISLKQDIIIKMNTEGRNDKYSPLSRAFYYRKYDKQFTFYGIRIPIYKKNNLSKQIIMDFTVETSNKYLKEYLDKNIHLVKDQFNSTIYPMMSELTLKKEGKTILAKKLKRELNKLIKNLKIKGHIDRVYIHSILVS